MVLVKGIGCPATSLIFASLFLKPLKSVLIFYIGRVSPRSCASFFQKHPVEHSAVWIDISREHSAFVPMRDVKSRRSLSPFKHFLSIVLGHLTVGDISTWDGVNGFGGIDIDEPDFFVFPVDASRDGIAIHHTDYEVGVL